MNTKLKSIIKECIAEINEQNNNYDAQSDTFAYEPRERYDTTNYTLPINKPVSTNPPSLTPNQSDDVLLNIQLAQEAVNKAIEFYKNTDLTQTMERLDDVAGYASKSYNLLKKKTNM